MGAYKRLSEAFSILFGTPKQPLNLRQGVAVLGAVEQSFGVIPSTGFTDQVDVFNEDPVVKESVQQFAQEIISTGFFTTIDEKYDLVLLGKTAKDVIDEWNRANDLDNKILQIAIELVAFGNSIWNIVDGFVSIPIQSIYQAVPVDKTTSVRDKYNLKLTASYGSKIHNFEEFIHFKTGVTGYEPFGSGIVLGLMSTPSAIDIGEEEDLSCPSLYDIRKSIRASMKQGFLKFSFGNELWSFDGLSDEQTTTVGEKIAEMGSTGQRIATNVKGDIKLAVPQRTQSYDKWIEQIDKEFLMALANPSLKLGIEGGFTKATSETARTMYECKVEALRRVIRRGLESLWTKVLNNAGFDGVKANPKLNFMAREVPFTLTDLLKSVELKIISKEEARVLLVQFAKWRLEDSKAPEEKVEPKEDEKGV